MPGSAGRHRCRRAPGWTAARWTARSGELCVMTDTVGLLRLDPDAAVAELRASADSARGFLALDPVTQNDFAMSAADRELADGMRRTIEEQHHTKRLFTMCGSKGQVVGFSWITSIDWRGQTCELSFAVLPRYRIGFGFKAVEAAHEYLREQLHMVVIINHVLSHATMMLSACGLY